MRTDLQNYKNNHGRFRRPRVTVQNFFSNCIAQTGALYLYYKNDNNNNHRLCGDVRLRREAKTVNRPNQNVKFIAV